MSLLSTTTITHCCENVSQPQQQVRRMFLNFTSQVAIDRVVRLMAANSVRDLSIIDMFVTKQFNSNPKYPYYSIHSNACAMYRTDAQHFCLLQPHPLLLILLELK